LVRPVAGWYVRADDLRAEAFGVASSDIGIIGFASSVHERPTKRPILSFFAEAARKALASAGLKKADINGLAISSFTLPPDNTVTVAEHFGMSLSWAYSFTAGGAGPIASVLSAKRAIEAGQADCVLCIGGDARDMAGFRRMVGNFNQAITNYAAPNGFGGMNGLFGIIMRKHMHVYGTTRAQLGRISVAQRANAQQNEIALLREPLTIEQYLNAPVIADPVHLYDCPMPVSGAEALIVGPLDRAPKGGGVRILSGFEQHNHPVGEIAPLRGGWELFRDKLYNQAGFGPADFDFVQPYDDYPVMVAIQLEDLGFCRKGEVGPFLERTDMTWRGNLPLNTGGGQLSCGATGGGGGLISIVEAVRQLRGEGGRRQVENARIGLVSGYGMVGYGHGLSASAAIVERDER